MESYAIRLARVADAAALQQIYQPFVEATNISFEYVAPTVAEFAQRIRSISAAYPYLVCESAGRPLGYAYAHRFRDRAAYDWDVETTVYFAPAGQGRGLGPIIYTALEELLALQGVQNLYGCVTGGNGHSLSMHSALGYQVLGTFPHAGFKNGRWLSIVWLGKSLGEFNAAPRFTKFTELDGAAVARVLTAANALLAAKAAQ